MADGPTDNRAFADEFARLYRRYERCNGRGAYNHLQKLASLSTHAINDYREGNVRPQRETIDKMGRIMGLTEDEIELLKGLAGYLPPSRLPSTQRIVEILSRYAAEQAACHRFPITVDDYRLRYFYASGPTAALLGVDRNTLCRWAARPEGITTFDTSFDSRLPIAARIVNRTELQYRQMFSFQVINRTRRWEPFYRDYRAWMDTRLKPEDARTFRATWDRVEDDLRKAGEAYPSIPIHGTIEIDMGAQRPRLVFNLIDTTIHRFGSAFNALRFVPANQAEHQDILDELFPNPPQVEGVALWELVNLDALLTAEDYLQEQD